MSFSYVPTTGRQRTTPVTVPSILTTLAPLAAEAWRGVGEGGRTAGRQWSGQSLIRSKGASRGLPAGTAGGSEAAQAAVSSPRPAPRPRKTSRRGLASTMTSVPTLLSSSVPPGWTQRPPDDTATRALPSRALPGADAGCAGREGGNRRTRRACALCRHPTVSRAACARAPLRARGAVGDVPRPPTPTRGRGCPQVGGGKKAGTRGAPPPLVFI